MPRSAGTVVRLLYPNDQTACSSAIQVRALLPNGEYGPNLVGVDQFSITNENGNFVKLADSGATLVNRTWYGITDDAGTKIDFVVIVGDVELDGDVDALDVNAIWNNRFEPITDDIIFDVEGDGDIDALDVNTTWNNRDALVAPVPDKPTGHTCPN